MALNFFRRKKKQPSAPMTEETTDETIRPESEQVPGLTNLPQEAGPEMTAIPDREAESAGVATAEDRAPAIDSRPVDEDSPTNGQPASGGFYQSLRKGLSKTRRLLTTDIDELFGQKNIIDQDLLDELEERLITSDMGVQTATEIIETVSGSRIASVEELRHHLKKTILNYLSTGDDRPHAARGKPHIIMVVGVNGVGKTTTIGKLAAGFTESGKSVLLVAADTFRAAAIEQLDIWAQRVKADIVKHRPNSDPAAVVFDGLEAARARNTDIVLIDTAGRLHTKTNLMEELKKIKRTIAAKIPEAPHEVLLVLDATTGQNALSQARTFIADTGVTGLVLTKLDGTARGGIAINLCHTFKIPLRYVGIGEQIDDLQPFQPEKFIDAML